jgi:WD40 repeat protein
VKDEFFLAASYRYRYDKDSFITIFDHESFMICKSLACCSFLLIFSCGAIAQDKDNAPTAKTLPSKESQVAKIPDVASSGKTVTAKGKSKYEPQSQIDPVATGLRSMQEKPVPVLTASVRTIAVNKAGTLLAIGTGQGEILIWSIPDEKYITRWKGHDEWVFDLAFDENTGRLISGGGDNYTKFWSVKDWKRASEFLDHQDDVHGVALSPDGKTLITGGDDTLIYVRDLFTGAITELKGHTAQVTSVLVSSDGKTAYSSSRDQTIRVWDVEKLKEVAVLKGHEEDVLHLALDRSGKYLASASYDGTVRVWSLNSLETIQTLKVPDVWMLAVEFSADASIVFAGSTDFHVRAFDRESEKELWKSKTVSDVSDLVLSPDGKQLIASSSANGIFIYEISREKGVVSKTIPVTGNWSTRVSPLTTTEYLEMHHALLFEQDSDDWGKKVGLLSIHGDQFTDYLLQKMDISKLPAPKQELATRLSNRLRAKYEPFDGSPLSERVLAKFWGYYATAEHLGLGVSEPLSEWLISQTKKTKSAKEPKKIDAQLIRKEINTVMNELSKEDANASKRDMTQIKILLILNEIID